MWSPIVVMLTLAAFTHSYTTHEDNLRAGYSHFPGVGYYKYYTTMLSWGSAQVTCLEEGAQLVVVNSEQERQVLVDFIKEQKPQNISTYFTRSGFHDQYVEGSYVTTTDIPLEYAGFTKWETGYPTGKEDRDCGSISDNGLLGDIDCNMLAPFMCEKEIWTSSYEFYKEVGYYTLHTDGQTWDEAYKTCKIEGAHLAVVNSAAEANALVDLFSHFPSLPDVEDPNIANIGFSMAYDLRVMNNTAKNYFTIQGQSIRRSGYAQWSTGEPNPAGNLQCGAILRSGRLLMSSCSSRNAFFCEHELQDS